MKFTLDVYRNMSSVRRWSWRVFDTAKSETELRVQHEKAARRREGSHYYVTSFLHRPSTSALDHGTALTSASANRKARRAARRIASGDGPGVSEYKTKGDTREDLLETIARLEEELGL